ncbi:hypothetical protein [Hymenobacter wooponensis]|uniref:Uncharacterized protein n=1 Tax=Hymenobacter wooponensis TaxID=1525360 RepID=A0A4Z0MT06_9BACT|nr:hypothetical protein [Hymenobacter wooponensis]TGD82560.1 hypothetical protein EU557_01885 [Hymenobacter wooponensis]
MQLANELREQNSKPKPVPQNESQEYIPFGLYMLELEDQGHPKFYGINRDDEGQVISLPLHQGSASSCLGYQVSNGTGTFCLLRTTLALWVASLSLSQLKKYYPRVFDGDNASTMLLTPPDEFGVIMQPNHVWGQLLTNQTSYNQKLQQVAAETGVVIAHNEASDSYGLYYRSKLVGQAPKLNIEHLIKLLTHHMNTTVAYHQVKQRVLNERYEGVFPEELDNFDNWDGEIQEHMQFPMANLFYVRVKASTEDAALNMAKEEITLQRSLNPVRVVSRGVPFEIESVMLLDRVSDMGFYEVRYRFLAVSNHMRMASAS